MRFGLRVYEGDGPWVTIEQIAPVSGGALSPFCTSTGIVTEDKAFDGEMLIPSTWRLSRSISEVGSSRLAPIALTSADFAKSLAVNQTLKSSSTSNATATVPIQAPSPASSNDSSPLPQPSGTMRPAANPVQAPH